VTVNSTDGGAVSGALGLANTVVSNNSVDFDHLLSAAESLYGKTVEAQAANVKLAGTLAGTAQTAYADAASQAAGNKNLVLVGIAAVAIIAVAAFARNKG